MIEQITARRAELATEYETGRKMLTELDQQRASLEQTLLRINGAMQVLDELLTGQAQTDEGATNGYDN